jgi:hypothetical protein
LKVSDSGFFYCNGLNSEGSARDSIEIIIKQREEVLTTTAATTKKRRSPEVYIDHYRYDVHVNEGEDYNLVCKSDSVNVVFKWLRGTKVISNDSEYTIKNVKDEDEGTYSCVGDNEYGHDSESFHLSVRKGDHENSN